MNHVGCRVLDRVYELLSIDAEWSVKGDRGFTWWPGSLAQRVWVEPGRDDDGFSGQRLHVRTDFLKGIVPDGAMLLKLNSLAKHSALSAPILNAESGTLELGTSVYVHEQTERDIRQHPAAAGGCLTVDCSGDIPPGHRLCRR